MAQENSLTDEDKVEIRRLYHLRKLTPEDIQCIFDVTVEQIEEIVSEDFDDTEVN